MVEINKVGLRAQYKLALDVILADLRDVRGVFDELGLRPIEVFDEAIDHGEELSLRVSSNDAFQFSKDYRGISGNKPYTADEVADLLAGLGGTFQRPENWIHFFRQDLVSRLGVDYTCSLLKRVFKK